MTLPRGSAVFTPCVPGVNTGIHHLRYRKVHSARADFSAGMGIHDAVGSCGFGAAQREQLWSLLQVVGGAPKEHVLRGLTLWEGKGPHDMAIPTVKPQQLACTCFASADYTSVT